MFPVVRLSVRLWTPISRDAILLYLVRIWMKLGTNIRRAKRWALLKRFKVKGQTSDLMP